MKMLMALQRARGERIATPSLFLADGGRKSTRCDVLADGQLRSPAATSLSTRPKRCFDRTSNFRGRSTLEHHIEDTARKTKP